MPSSLGNVASEPGDSTPLLGRHAQALIACNQKLQELGIDNTIKLPQLVVVGDQSTGKSSLIEAISTVKVPQARGCCTQCPIGINLSSGSEPSSPWKCSVSIEEHYDFVQALLTKGVTKNNPFGPWQKRDSMRLVHVKTTHDKDEIPELIVEAQSRILKPGGLLVEQKFSPNVVRLDISEGSWPNLSFVDLPGVIANTGKGEDKFLVKLIRNLVQKYAAADRSINMLTLPMTHDIENSQACAIIQELKAEANTLAVFTKADLADEEQKAQFLRKFVGDDDLEFNHGYHFVIMPDSVDQDEARRREAHVFGNPPWSQLDQAHQARLGVEALRKYIRRLLFEKTQETLPENLASIETRLFKVKAELLSLPVPPNAALLPLQLQQSVTRFENAMKVLFSGDPTGKGRSARTEWLRNTLRFGDTVAEAKPTLFLLTQNEESQLQKAQAKIQKTNGGNATAEASSGADADHSSRTKPETDSNGKLQAVHRFRLEEIRGVNEQFYQACVPGEIELRAIEELNKLSVQHWDKLLDQFMGANSKLLSVQVGQVLDETFGSFGHLEICTIIRDFVKDYLQDIVHQEWSIAEMNCRLEMEKPFTLDSVAVKDKETKSYAERSSKRLVKRLALAVAESNVDGLNNRRKKIDVTDLGPDPFETELKMSCKTRAYYEVACTRFVDNVCLGIFGRMLPACSGQLVESLKKHLGLDDHTKHDQIISWMAENPEREAHRQKLLHEQKRLSEGLKYIRDALGMNRSSPTKRHQAGGADGAQDPETPSKRTKTTQSYGMDRLRLTITPGRTANPTDSMELDD